MRRSIARLVALLVALVQLAGCGTGSSSATEQDTVAIYESVIRQLYEVDDTFGGTLEKPVLYLIRATSDAASDPATQQTNSVLLSERVQQGIGEALSDLPTTVIWVDDVDQVDLDESGRARDGGVIVTLGNIDYESSDRASVAASLYFAHLAAGGRTYVLEKVSGAWTITGTTGPEWIS